MTAATGDWPDPERPGYPPAPEHDGVYLLDAPGREQPSLMLGHWSPDWRRRRSDDDPPCPGWKCGEHFYSPVAAGKWMRYLGPFDATIVRAEGQ